MGNFASTVTSPVKVFSRKRKLSVDYETESESDDSLQRLLAVPKRKKLMTTTHYIYKTLYEEGQNSDITITALKKKWRLHKIYLCQSHYFASMFSGFWKETGQDVINIEINDDNITTNALDLVFGSFYQDEIVIEPNNVISILAAGLHFQLDAIVQQAVDIIKETINVHTAVKYYYATSKYGYKDLHKSCFDWLLINLLGTVSEYPACLREINLDLMLLLINSSELFAMQTEFSTYYILKMWVFLQEHQDWAGTRDQCTDRAHKYFINQEGEAFISTDNGQKYQPVFRTLRLNHLINHHYDVEMMEHDKIIPNEWLSKIYRLQWYKMLQIDQGVDKGPTDIPEDTFKKLCFRCGRSLNQDGYHMWRWTGFNFGLDLLVTYDEREIKFRRNHRLDTASQSSLSPTLKRHIVYRVTAVSVDDQQQTRCFMTTGIRHVHLSKNEEIDVLHLDEEATFPLLISANFMVITPIQQSQTDLVPAKGSSTQNPIFNDC